MNVDDVVCFSILGVRADSQPSLRLVVVAIALRQVKLGDGLQRPLNRSENKRILRYPQIPINVLAKVMSFDFESRIK